VRSGICAKPCRHSQFHAAPPCNFPKSSLQHPQSLPAPCGRENLLQAIETIRRFAGVRLQIANCRERSGRETVLLLTASSATQSVSRLDKLIARSQTASLPSAFGGDPGLVALMCIDCGTTDSVLVHQAHSIPHQPGPNTRISNRPGSVRRYWARPRRVGGSF
jgi:hypothetical protein